MLMAGQAQKYYSSDGYSGPRLLSVKMSCALIIFFSQQPYDIGAVSFTLADGDTKSLSDLLRLPELVRFGLTVL
jgi:hypothetical protein